MSRLFNSEVGYVQILKILSTFFNLIKHTGRNYKVLYHFLKTV